ncbi:MAG: PH domain-containing protein [Steroidobacteraceae bacterium]
MKARPAGEDRLLRHPTSTLVIAIVGLGLFGTVTVASIVTSKGPGDWWIPLVGLGFMLMSVPMVVDYFVARHEVTDEGLHYRKFVGTRKFMRWSEVRNVRYASGMKWFRLESTSDEVARLSVMLMGLPEFARMLLAHVPDGAIEPAALPLLRETAAGRPPSVWM